MKSIGVAVVGLGMIARTHIAALKAMPVSFDVGFTPLLHTVLTTHPREKALAASQMGFMHVTDQLEEVLANPDIHLVDICTPNALHYDVAAACLAAGKAVYCEKPVTDCATRTEQLVELAAASGTLQQVALVYRYHPGVLEAKVALQSGMIGELLHFRLQYLHSSYLRADRPISWRTQRALSGGGALVDLGVHAIDLIRFICGDLLTFDGRVETFIKERPEATTGQRITVDVDDWALVHAQTVGGAKGFIEVSRVALGSECHRLELYGTKGSILIDLERERKVRIQSVQGPLSLTERHAAMALLPPDKLSLGTFVDVHMASLYHCLRRVHGEFFEPNHAPTFADAAIAERVIHTVLEKSRL